MTRNIPGLLDYSKLMPAKPAAASAESLLPYDQRAHHDFALLPGDQQLQAIRRFAASGCGDHEIATRTGLHVEQVRRLLSEHEAQPHA